MALLNRTYVGSIAAIAALCLLSSCSKDADTGEVRLLLLPFENDSPDAGLNWLTPVSSAVLEYDLNSVAHWSVTRGESVRAIADSKANRVLEGYFALEREKLTLHAFLESAQEHKTLQVIVREGPASAGIQPLLDSVAKQLTASARPFSSRDPAALQSYGEALQSPDPATRLRLLQAATTRDPRLSAAGIALAELLLAQGNRTQAADVAASGARSAVDRLDRARLEYLSATARGDFGAREQALQSLTKLAPSSNTFELLGQVHTSSRKYREAIHDYEEVARLDPRNPVAYNAIGYLRAYLHDLPDARKSMEEYGKLSSPNDPNPLDSLGEVHFMLGDFSAAERYFTAAQAKTPGGNEGREILKAAVARLLTGDVSGADALFQKSLDLFKVPDRQTLEIPRAQWEYFSGRRKQAMLRLEKLLTSSNPDVFALAGAQQSFWKLLSGDRYAAAVFSSNAMGRAVNPGLRNMAAICLYLAQPASVKSPPNAWLQGLASVLMHQVAPAVPLLEEVYRQTPPGSDSEVRAILAWAYVQAKQPSAAKPLVELYPLIFPTADALFAGFTLPRFLAARAEVLQSEHNDSEARRMQQLANQLAGDLPDRL